MRADRPRRVPWLLVRLKLRLLRNRARTQSAGAFFLVLSVVAAVVVGLIFAIGAAALVRDGDPRVVRTTLVVGASVFTLGWTILPLVTFGYDESLDPARLVLLPLRRTPLMRGLLATSLVGPGPLAVLLVVTGVVLGLLGTTMVVLPAVILLVLFTVTAARTTSTLLGARITSRKGRDATILVVSVLAVAIQGVRFVDFTFLDAHDIDRLDGVLRWLPPGMLGQAVVDAADGRLGVALVQLLPAALLIPVLLQVWARALDRSLTTVVGETAAVRRERARTDLPLLFDRFPLTPATATGAVTARELRYLWREPRHKVNLVNTVMFGAGLPLFFVLRSGGGLSDRTVLLSTVAGYLVILSANNQFGLDGAATWLDVTAGDSMRPLLVGKNVATACLVLPVVLVVGLVTAALSGGWAYLPGALLLGVAGLGAGLATANVVSVRYPFPLPESRSPLAGSGGGQGCATGAVLMACLLVQGLIMLPVAIALVIGGLAGPGWLTVAAVVALGYGAFLWRAGVDMAEADGRDREPERIIAVDPARTKRR